MDIAVISVAEIFGRSWKSVVSETKLSLKD